MSSSNPTLKRSLGELHAANFVQSFSKQSSRTPREITFFRRDSMKRVLIVVVLVVGAATLGLWRSHGGVRQGLSRVVGASSDNSEGVTGDETRKSFELEPGA